MVLTTYLRNDMLIPEKKGGVNMQGEKTVKIIETVRNMTDHEADILEVFMSGFRAGKQVSKQEIGNESVALPTTQAG